jgi:hypothetical protein
MTILAEPTIIPEGDPNSDFWYNSQLQQLFFAAQNLQLTSRDGAIQNNDKAGNLSGVYCVFTSNGAANTEDAVPHTLGRIPLGYIVVHQDKAAVVYDSGTAFTDTKLYLKSSAASVAWTLLVF